EFAKKYELPIRQVIQPRPGSEAGQSQIDVQQAPFTTTDGTLVNSGPFTGLACEQALKQMAQHAEKQGFGKATITYRQKDWGFSRQRYWGTPIPILYCDKCDPQHAGIPVPYEQLPVRLPDIDVKEVLTGKGEPPLAKVPGFVATTCPKCGGPARRETETMDTFVDSTWYFARYLSPHYSEG